MGKSTSSQQSTNSSQTATPTNPTYVDQGLAGITGKINDLTNADPYSFVAGANPLQTQAGATAGALTGTPGLYAGSTDLATSIGQMDSPDIASLMNPFKGAFDNRVINPALQAFDQNSNLTNAQNRLNLGNDATFGGSGAAITDALTHGQQELARGQLQGGLLSDQFKTALQGATSQAGVNQTQQGLRLNAAGQLTTNANDINATGRDNATTMSSIGDLLRQIQQQQAAAPLTVAGSLAGDYSSLPLSLEHGMNTTGTGSTSTSGSEFGLSGEDLGKMAMAAAMISDRRLKRNIVKLAEHTNGVGIYAFSYLWSEARHIGVMAQEVLKVKPEAVVSLPSGFMAVNYGML
jgi:hypothetical protein